MNNKGWLAKCIRCNSEYIAKTINSKYCSAKCCQAAAKERKRAYALKVKERMDKELRENER